ncbi:lipopolysaccharide biosynthesis protein [Muriicola sp. Z0-33]|uniref:lipopolysaccharide biosynthesis protein n=1 Tax=Muriicola sp. Z0-33 TaxID=2816957 RepID=UPI00223805FA|nr:oligosaccharide flippase family protein [Muriicola sp. Z0-33]MCW5515670.1 oligosaccharide flippase family protein [Muriicola sp. Z0-33]
MNLLERVKTLFLKGNARSVRAKKNVVLTIVIKAFGVLIGFIYFPLSLDYLGAVKFGIFLTLLSIVDWFLNFDIGIGHGLRNRFGEAVAYNNDEKAVHYVSTAYFTLGTIVTILTGVLLILNFTLPWTLWLNIAPNLTAEVEILGAIIIIAFGIRFVSSNIYEIFFALQKMAYVEFFSFLTKASFLVLILLIPFVVEDSLLLFGTAKSLTFALVPLAVGLYYFRRNFSKYKPSLKYVRLDYFKDLFSLGIKFFLIKIAMLVIHQTNNILIASFVSLEGVPQYEAAYKYLSIFMMLFVILNNQLWPSNLDAYAKGDYAWMKKSMRIVLKIWVGTVVLAALMVIISPFIYELWLRDNLYIPIVISIAVAGSICLTTWVNMFNLVLNGTGKIKLQMYAWIFAAVINIPASLFFVKVLNLGVVGIVLGTITSLIPLAILSPLQVLKILARKEKGIWAK